MAKIIFKNEIASQPPRYRVVCAADSFKGPWREKIEEAYEDGRQHRQQGNEVHFTRIEAEETVSRKFEE